MIHELSTYRIGSKYFVIVWAAVPHNEKVLVEREWSQTACGEEGEERAAKEIYVCMWRGEGQCGGEMTKGMEVLTWQVW